MFVRNYEYFVYSVIPDIVMTDWVETTDNTVIAIKTLFSYVFTQTDKTNVFCCLLLYVVSLLP